MIRFPSPGLSTIFNEIRASTRNYILDLGEMRPGTFNYFAGLNCKFHFENLCDLIGYDKKRDGKSFSESLDLYLTRYDRGTQFDVILLWDFINFLSISELTILFDRLKPYCKENTLIHSLTYIKKSIPIRPSRFQISGDDCLDIELDKTFVEKAERITTLTVVKSLPNFILETNSFNDNNLRIGIVENLLRYVPHLESNKKSLIRKKYSSRSKQDDIPSGLPAGLTTHFSPGLLYVLEALKEKEDSKLLNLGEDIEENNNALLGYAGSVFPESLLTSLKRDKDNYMLSLRQQSLVYCVDIKYDAILIWDFFNYMSVTDICRVNERLMAFSKPGTLVYIINYSGEEKPISPQRFYIAEDGHIGFKPKRGSTENPDLLNAVTISKAFKNAKVKKSFLLQPGMAKGFYEYILECM